MTVGDATLRQGHHCAWWGDANWKGYWYPLRNSNTDYRRFTKGFLESPILDANITDESDPKPRPLWWTVELWGFETVQEPIVGLVSNLFESPERAWQPDNPSGGPPNATRHTHLQARVFYMNNSEYTRWIDVDIGSGTRLSVQADQVFVGLLVPPDALPVSRGSRNKTTFTGNLDDGERLTQALVGGTISLSPYSTNGRNICTNTKQVLIPSDAVNTVIPIPPAAKRVQVYAQKDGAIPDPCWQTGIMRAPADVFTPGFPDSGALFIDPTARRTLNQIDIPQHASAIVVPTPSEEPRILTFVFELDT